jgi:hypothetical protein
MLATLNSSAVIAPLMRFVAVLALGCGRVGYDPIGACGAPGQSCCAGQCYGAARCLGTSCETCSLVAGSPCGDVQAAAIRSSGQLGPWQPVGPFSVGRYGNTGAAVGEWLYVLGGASHTSPDMQLADVQQATFAGGLVRSWSTTAALPNPTWYGAAASAANHLYVVGGHAPSSESPQALVSTLQPDGSCSPWVASTPLPGPLAEEAIAATDSRLYVLGGLVNGASTLDAVWSAPLSTDGVGAWTAEPSLPQPRSGLTSVVARGRLYVLGGGIQMEGWHDDVLAAVIAADGTLSAWTMAGQFATARGYHASVVAGGFVYVAGGFTGAYGAGKLTDVAVGAIAADGSVGPFVATSPLPSPRDSFALLATSGYLIAAGGAGE